MATITASGTNSGLDINKIITDLMAAERKAPTQRLDTLEAKVQAKLSAVGTLKGALSDFQSAIADLNSATQFQTLSATPGDDTLLSATATSVAQAGNYDITITKLAQAHTLVTSASYRFDGVSDVVGTGTLTFSFGTVGGSFVANPNKTDKTVTIDAGNNTLTGVRDAINNAGIGVRAKIVNDGSGYRLSLSATDSGAANSLKISVDDGDGTDTNQSGLSQLAYDPFGTVDSGKNMTQTVVAQDAELTVDGLGITSAGNSVTGIIPGVTLDLKKADGTPTTLTVAQDSAAVGNAVNAFVAAYNKLIDTNKSLTFYKASTGESGALIGNAGVRSIISQVNNVLGSLVTGSTGTLHSLADVGVGLQRDGTLALDSSKLQAALASDPRAVAGLFARVTRASDSLVSAGSTSKTKAGTYALSVTQLATQAQYIAANAIGVGPFTINAGNNTIALIVNGKAVTATLTNGSYADGTALATELQKKINANSTLAGAGITMSVGYSAGTQKLTFTTNTYGSTSSIEFTQSNTTLGISAGQSKATGQDVSGTLGGVAITGVGQKLTGSGAAAGITADILGGAIGSRGTISISEGVANRLDSLLSDFLGSDGLLSNQTESLNKEVEQITGQRASLEARMNALEARYRAQFQRMDALIGQFSATSTFLTQQLAANNKSSS